MGEFLELGYFYLFGMGLSGSHNFGTKLCVCVKRRTSAGRKPQKIGPGRVL